MSIGGSQTSSSADPVGGSTTLTAPGRPSNKDPRSTARGSAAGQSLSSDTYSATESPASSQPYLGGVVLASPSSSSASRSAVTDGDGGTYSSATPRSHASKSGRPTLSQSRDDAQETHSRKPAQTSQYYPSGGSNAGRGPGRPSNRVAHSLGDGWIRQPRRNGTRMERRACASY